MWYTWTTLLLVSCALVKADGEAGAEAPAPVATTRAPPRTLDRKAAELAWKSWLQSPESGNQNAPPRRITTKSLFITPLVCPKGQRLDRNGCIQVVTVNKDEHERILLEQLNALFTTPPSGDLVNTDVLYDYGEDEPGPLQLSIPIGLDPQAAPLQGQEPSAQAQELQPSYINLNKKHINNTDASIEAELELLKLQNSFNRNDTVEVATSEILNHNILTNIHNNSDKPKRNSPDVNETENESKVNIDLGQKEVVYGHVNVDPITFETENHNADTNTEKPSVNVPSIVDNHKVNASTLLLPINTNDNGSEEVSNSTVSLLKKNGQPSKLNPENDYSDIGEAIKLISRYADVTTDDNFAKEPNKHGFNEENILGTRTKLQYRRNKPKDQHLNLSPLHVPVQVGYNDEISPHSVHQSTYYRYPWQSQHWQKPPPEYPFRHLQDYWPGRNQVGGVYNTHSNPRRHHHSYSHQMRLRGYPANIGAPSSYPEHMNEYIQRLVQQHANPVRLHTNNQDLYNLLGLRHWFSSEGTSKR